MDEIGFIFQISDVEARALLPQISKALEKRLELRSRAVMPGVWKKTDQLNEKKMTPKEEKRFLRGRMIRAVLFIILGMMLALPGLAGKSENHFLTLVGAVVVVIGILNLRNSKVRANVKKNPEKFDKAAAEFLRSHIESVAGQSVQVCFSDEEMITVMGELEELDQEAIEFAQVEYVIETRDIFLIIYGKRGSMLQKKDITLGTVDEFREFLNEKVKPVILIDEEE